MPVQVDYEKLRRVEDAVRAEGQQDRESGVIGRVDRDRWPVLPIAPVDDVRSFRCAVSPDCSYRLAKRAVDAATQELLIYIYDISAPQLLDLIRDAKARGVAVRAMYDATSGGDAEGQAFNDLGVNARPAPSIGRREVFTVCHQKFVVVDRRSVLVESANWASTGFPRVTVPGQFRKGNREWLIHIEDERVAGFFRDLFEADWEIPELEGPSGVVGSPPLADGAVGGAFAPAAIAGQPARVFDIQEFTLAAGCRVTPILSPNNYFDLCRERIQNAGQRVWVQQQYIKAGGPRTQALLMALAGARERGVEVRAIVSPAFRQVGRSDSWEQSRNSLDAYGLKDCLRAMNLEFFTHCHNKGVLVDDRYVIVSSTNWSENSVAEAREAGVLVESAEIAAYYAEVFDFDWQNGLPEDQLPDNFVAPAVPADEAGDVAASLESGDLIWIPPGDLV